MEFIAKIVIKEKISEEGKERSKKNYNDPEYMKKLKEYQMLMVKQSFHMEENFSLDIEYELKEEDE